MNTTFDQAVQEIAKEIADLVVSKRRDYGPKNIMNSVVAPEISIAVRINDKIARLVNLIQNGATPENESLLDTAHDIVGYGLVLTMVLEGKFLLPLEKKNEITGTSK